MFKTGDVIWLFAGTIDPPKDKMHVCVCVAEGWFFRINTKGHFRGSMPIALADNPFLNHDSHIECGAIIDWDEDEVEEAIERQGAYAGRLGVQTLKDLYEHVKQLPTLNAEERQAILSALEGALERQHTSRSCDA